jgi:hypothetical protein
MGEVVDILKNTPHQTGSAHCTSCGFKWVAVAPVDTKELECGRCGKMTGEFLGCALGR